VKKIEAYLTSANESAAFVNGYTEGQQARAANAPLTAYLRVGIDDYARGYRTGYFARATPAVATVAERPRARQVVNL
jgi:hypothetical protein